jgi:hypothetical protein
MMDNPGASSIGNPLANQTAPEQPMGPQQGNPLARIAPSMQPAQQPAPTKAQTTAAVQRFSAIQAAMRSVMENPQFGKQNVRPAIMDAASKLLGSKLLSLPEIMNSLADVPEDPIKQKAFVQGVFNNAKMAEASVLDHHGAAIVSGKLPPDGGGEYDAGNHESLMDGLMGHYRRA